MTDPIDNAPAPTPEHATMIERALGLYSAFTCAMAALAASADQTAAKNYISIGVAGMRLPFDRVEVTLLRPGGKTPADRVTELEVARVVSENDAREAAAAAQAAVAELDAENGTLRDRIRELEEACDARDRRIAELVVYAPATETP